MLDLVQPTIKGGGEPPQFWPQIQALGWYLKSALDTLTEVDRTLLKEKAQRAALVKQRDGKAGHLTRVIGGLRRAILGYYVSPGLPGLGLDGETAREPLAVLRQGEVIEEQLQREDLGEVLGERLLDPAPDPGSHVEQLKPAVSELRSVFDQLNDSKRRVEELVTEKNEAMKQWDEVFLRVARQFEDLCRLAGKKELANRVRPSTTRSGRTAVEPPGDEVPSSSDDVVSDAAGTGTSPSNGESATDQSSA